MAETLSNTYTFDLPVDEIIEQALEPLGGEQSSEDEVKKARRALNLLFIDMQNRGMVPLASMEQIVVDLVSGSAEGYALDSKVLNILDAVIRTSSTNGSILDIPLDRYSYQDWLNIPNKNQEQRPTKFLVDKQRDGIKVSFWPKPNASNFKFICWSCVKVTDVTKSYQLVDFRSVYLPAIVAGLRWKMSEIRRLPIDERMYYKNEYLETLQMALDEDRERKDYHVYPEQEKVL